MRLELDSFKTTSFAPPRNSNLCPVMAGRSNTARQPVAQKTQCSLPLRGWQCTFHTYAGQAINLFCGRPTAPGGRGHWYCVTILPPKFIE
jgi:hypothetical protein